MTGALDDGMLLNSPPSSGGPIHTEAHMFLLVLKALALFFGIVFLLYGLLGLFLMIGFPANPSAPGRRAQRENDLRVLLVVALFMLLLSFLIWPMHCLFSKKDAWWTRGWLPLSVYTVLGVGLLLVGRVL